MIVDRIPRAIVIESAALSEVASNKNLEFWFI